MSRLAILVGNTIYDQQQNLPCCTADVEIMHSFLTETRNYENIEIIQNLSANDLKDKLRNIVDPDCRYEEIFFYFTGHGYQVDKVFYFCATDFRTSRPNETGLSNADLLNILRAADPELIVQIVDACNSGTRLIKDASYGAILPVPKDGIKNYIQIASCLEDQNSLTGDPLSPFTEKFVEASLKKTHGEIYYSDVMNILRDEFLDNITQIPFFVSQGTGREIFISDASLLNSFRDKMHAETDAPATDASNQELQHLSLMERLKLEEEKFCTSATADKFITTLFDSLKTKLIDSKLMSECYNLEISEEDRYYDSGITAFMVRVLAKEKRQDEFVTAEIHRERKKRNPLNPLLGASQLLLQSTLGLIDDDEINETYDLSLNCSLEKAQFEVVLKPKFRCLSQFKLVVSCAPSVEHCYVFERGTVHKLCDWDSYSPAGEEITRRWYKMAWADGTASLTDKIANQLNTNIENHISQFVGTDTPEEEES